MREFEALLNDPAALCDAARWGDVWDCALRAGVDASDARASIVLQVIECAGGWERRFMLSLIHISEPTRLALI
eukprot:11964173-Alexandrium_andersonii.AAC.1